MEDFQAPADQQSAGSDSGFVTNPQYQQQQQQPQSTAGSDFVDNPHYAPPGSVKAGPSGSFLKPSDADYANGLDVDGTSNPFMKGVKEVNAVGAGLGEGLLSTINGAADILHVPHQLLKDRQAELERDNANNPVARTVGYGGETLLEIVMGDEAIKALPLAKRLLYASKTMETLERSPKLMALLKAGAAQEAVKAAMLQGSQTFIRSGGDVKQAAEDAAMAGAFGGSMKVAGNAIGLGAKSAKTILGMNDAAKTAPSETGLFSKVADDINEEKSRVKGIYDKAMGEAESDRSAATSQAEDTFASQKDKAEEMLKSKQDQDSASFADRSDKIAKGRQAARKYTQTTLTQGLGKLGGDAPDVEDLAKKVNEGINEYEAGAHTAYEEGINGENGLVPRLEGTSQPVTESKISSKAGELLHTPDPGEHEAVAEAMAGAGDKLDARVKTLLQNLKDGTKKVPGTDAEGKPITIEKPMKDWTADSLIKFRQTLRKWAAKGFQRGDINRDVLGELINSVDDTLESLAGQAHDTTVLSDYSDLRKTYKMQRALLDSNVADKLKLNEPDKALADVGKFLTGGQNAPGKLGTIRQIIGEDSMQQLGRAQVKAWQKLAEDDPKKFLSEFNAMGKNPAVRTSFFGPELEAKLKGLADSYTNMSGFADEHAKMLAQQLGNDSSTAKSATRQLFGNTGPGAKQLGGLVGEGYKVANETKLSDIASRYTDAVNAATEAFHAEPANAPSSFLKNLSEGRVNDALLKGDVDLKDIRTVKNAIGDKWDGIGDGIFQRAIADAAPHGGFNPEKLMEWWNKIPQDNRTELFNLDKPENLSRVQKLMDDVTYSAEGRRMVKWAAGTGAITGAAAVGAGVGSMAGVIGPHLLGPLGEVLGMMTGVGSSKELIRKTIEFVADHPRTWRTFLKVNELADSKAAQAVKRVAPYASSTMRQVYGGAQGSLSQ